MTTDSRGQLRRRLEEHLNELPSLPTAVAQLMQLEPEDEHHFEKLLAILEAEPNLSTRVLARANAVPSAGRAPITTLRAALTRIGSESAANLVLSLALISVFIPRDEWERSLWRHAIQVATAARELALRCRGSGLDPDEAYACGLLHDVGRFVMFLEAPDQLRLVDEGGWDQPAGLLERELEICGLTHSGLGALACHRWGLPPTIAQVVQDHHLPPRAGHDDHLTRLIQIADLAMFPSAIPGTPGIEAADDATLETLRRRLPPYLTLGLGELRELLALVVKKAHISAAVMGVEIRHRN